MKYTIVKEISDLTDDELKTAYVDCGQAIAKREEASQHPKFTTNVKKMEFPPVNPNFTLMYNEIQNEMNKRKLIDDNKAS